MFGKTGPRLSDTQSDSLPETAEAFRGDAEPRGDGGTSVDLIAN
jgi:hypothetical protein